MSGILKVPYNIVRGLVRGVVNFIIMFSCLIIKTVTFEPGEGKRLTERKARRIRALSKFKIAVMDTLPTSVNRFLGFEEYKDYLDKHIRNGLQLRYE